MYREGGSLPAEVFYTLIGNSKRLGANPLEYIRDVIDRVFIHPASHVQKIVRCRSPRFVLSASSPAGFPLRLQANDLSRSGAEAEVTSLGGRPAHRFSFKKLDGSFVV
jgi:hypothetical protein